MLDSDPPDPLAPEYGTTLGYGKETPNFIRPLKNRS